MADVVGDRPRPLGSPRSFFISKTAIGQRKQVTVLFADPEGSVNLPADCGPEEGAVAAPAAARVSTHEIWEMAQKKSETP